MKIKNVIITGSNSGIGKASAKKFAENNYTVIMACRNLEKSRIIQNELIKITGNDKIDLIKLDVSSFKSIREFNTIFRKKYDELNILIHNAGYFNHGAKEYQKSEDNLELTFATNIIGPFLMTILLKDLMSKSDDSRILNACSTNIRHFLDPKRKIDFEMIYNKDGEKKSYNSYKMYGDSKMALLMLTFKLFEFFKKDGIAVNAVQIPAIKLSKETIKKFKPAWKLAALIQNIFSAPPETMADTYFEICTSEKFKGISGKFINDKREIIKPSSYKSSGFQAVKQLLDKGVYPNYADNEDDINRIWNLCLKLTAIQINS